MDYPDVPRARRAALAAARAVHARAARRTAVHRRAPGERALVQGHPARVRRAVRAPRGARRHRRDLRDQAASTRSCASSRDQLSALDTLPPQRFAQFRGSLGTSSGSQSVQFRAIEAASGLRDHTFLHARVRARRAAADGAGVARAPHAAGALRALLAAHGETSGIDLHRRGGARRCSCSPRNCWSTSRASRAGASCTCSSWSGSSAPARRAPAARSARSISRAR